MQIFRNKAISRVQPRVNDAFFLVGNLQEENDLARVELNCVNALLQALLNEVAQVSVRTMVRDLADPDIFPVGVPF